MNELFSDYVASLGDDGEPPDVASYEAVREGLRALLVGEMRRRSLWTAPPHYLGVSGARWADGALDELVSDAYTFIFLRRLRGLGNRQKVLRNIRPMVVRNVRNFLTQRQQKADPLGYRVFGRLKEGVKKTLERGSLFVRGQSIDTEETSAAKPRIANATILSFEPGLAPLVGREDLQQTVPTWTDDLLPELITAEGRSVPELTGRLAEKLGSLESDGVKAFRFGDLVAELKRDVRQRWNSAWQHSLGPLGGETGGTDELPRPVPITQPEEPDTARWLQAIQSCVESSISALRRRKLRDDLWSLWLHIRVTRIHPGADGPLPSFSELGRQLGLTRDRVKQLLEKKLQPIVMTCLRTADRPAPPSPALSRAPIYEAPEQPATDDARERRRASGMGSEDHEH